MKSLDYSALSQPLNSADIDIFKKDTTPNRAKNSVAIAVHDLPRIFWVVTVVWFVLVGFTFAVLLGAHIFSWIVLPVIVFALVVIGGMVLALRARTKQLARLYKFAQANNLKFAYNKANPTYAGMIFDEGHSRQVSEAYSFSDGKEMGNYQYVTGSGKNQQTHNWGYVRLKLTRHLPNMVLDAKENNFLGKFTNLPDSFSKGQTLMLEGDFNNHFILYAPKEYERDALYVFTPDVMAAVVDSGKSYDMEVIDDNLMLYSKRKFDLASQSELEALLKITNAIGAELLDQSKHYADERVGDRTQNIIAAPGKRLKTRFSIFAVVVIVIVVLYNLLNIVSSFMAK